MGCVSRQVRLCLLVLVLAGSALLTGCNEQQSLKLTTVIGEQPCHRGVLNEDGRCTLCMWYEKVLNHQCISCGWNSFWNRTRCQECPIGTLAGPEGCSLGAIPERTHRIIDQKAGTCYSGTVMTSKGCFKCPRESSSINGICVKCKHPSFPSEERDACMNCTLNSRGICHSCPPGRVVQGNTCKLQAREF